jgi:hypothetical protein
VTDPERVDRAARELIRAAGRPEALWWEHLSEHEREGWRHMVRVVLAAYND